ncbi:DUF6049 family protein [Actinomyces sp. F1_1611]
MTRNSQWRAHTTALIWCFLLLLGGAGWSWLAPSAHADETTPGTNRGDEFSIAGLSPELYEPGDDLRLTLDVGALRPGTQWFAEAFLQPTQFNSAEQMSYFLQGEGFPGWRIGADQITVRDEATLDWTVPADEMPIPDAQTTGARGLTVRFSNGDQLWEARSLLIYAPLEELPRTRVSLLAHDSLSPTQVDSVEQFVDQFTQLGGFSLAVSPQVAYGTEGRNAELIDQHRQTLVQSGADLVVLPEANADISALAAADLTPLMNLALESRTEGPDDPDSDPQDQPQSADPPTAPVPSDRLLTDIAMASPTGFTLEALQKLTGNTVIAPATWGVPELWHGLITPTSRLQIGMENGVIATEGTPNSIRVVDRWVPVEELLNEPVESPGQELLIRQQLRTISMMVGLQDPSDQRSLFAELQPGFDWAKPELTNRVLALLNNQWVEPTGLSELLESTPSEIGRQVVPRNGDEVEAYLTQLAPLAREYQRAEAVAMAGRDGNMILAPYRETVLAPTAASLTESERTALVTQAVKDLTSLSQSIKVLPLSTVNVVHHDADFPVSITNQGPEEVTLEVGLVPSSPHLQAGQLAHATIPAGGQVEVKVPVRAVGSGDVSVQVVARNLSGQIVDDSQSVTVRVRPTWEDIGTIVVVGAALLLFTFGIIRSVRRGRRRVRRAAPPPPSSAAPVIDSN